VWVAAKPRSGAGGGEARQPHKRAQAALPRSAVEAAPPAPSLSGEGKKPFQKRDGFFPKKKQIFSFFHTNVEKFKTVSFGKYGESRKQQKPIMKHPGSL
jgi:hypothetical protein